MTGSNAAEPYTKDFPFPARVTENRLLSRPGSAKETRHFVIDLSGSGLHYNTGDSLGVFPRNRPQEVAEILRLLGATGGEPVSPAALKLAAPMPLREALEGRLALAKPTRKIVEVLAARATEPVEKAKLEGMLAPEAKDLLAGYLEQREFVDLLAEFPSARLAPQEFVDHLRRLMPRLYSIASSPRVHPTEIHLTIAVVRYESNHRERVGVCSTFLAERVPVGAPVVPVFVSHSHFGPPEDPTRDCIMIGPGTGIAPFRAFLQDRAALGATGRNWLFFGDQKRATDFLYEEEWAEFQARGQLTRFDTAFSRDQPVKVYVQDRMRAQAAELWRWIDAGACVYVCGDAKRMARDVDTTLHDIVAEQGGRTVEEATEYVRQMKKDKRYQRDVY
ncbi:sulfite reductase subunit alpha [Opitutus sp. ER46]|uniref:sulfite reductase subunit alpha n=1 Tax=Opitutus sp. ER46 TaxID=2161864 RepID=UPI000D2F6423|nr:sulfite reductase subunit alpha [Opitutus sp. ER46]PTX92633.1 sulfite reductase subunit alpha [Opitutus sp. ER46]